MGEKDRAEKLFMGCPDVFAELVNVLVYQGERVLAEDSMVPGPTESTYLGKKAKLAGQFQDYSMYETVRGEIHALYTVENQSDVDPQMVLRHAGYEGAAYRRQYGQGKAVVQTRPEGQNMLAGQTMPEGHGMPADQPMSGERIMVEGQTMTEGHGMLGGRTMPEGRAVYPVISLVLNWGEQRWTAATAIHDLIGYPVHRGAEDYVDKNRMHVFDMRFLDGTVRGLFEGDVRVVLDYLSDRESLIRRRQELRNPEEVMRMLHALSGDTRYLKYISIMKEKGGSAVCDLLDEMVNKGIEIGKKRGIEEGLQKGLQEGLQKGLQKGLQDGLKALISTCRGFGFSFEETAERVKENFCLGDEETGNSMKLYW